MIGKGPDFAEIKLPDEDSEVLPGIKWGHVGASFTPANWYYCVEARKHSGNHINNKIGETLLEEVCACLLGGYGIPAYVGLAAFNALKGNGAFNGTSWDAITLERWLSEPLLINDKAIKYRFSKQKAGYLAGAIEHISKLECDYSSGKALRNSLLPIKGAGYKTCSWVARNWLGADDVAILDVHILRAGKIGGFLDSSLTVQKDYLRLEEQFIEFSNALGIRTSELDAEIWFQFSEYGKLTHRILRELEER